MLVLEKCLSPWKLGFVPVSLVSFPDPPHERGLGTWYLTDNSYMVNRNYFYLRLYSTEKVQSDTKEQKRETVLMV